MSGFTGPYALEHWERGTIEQGTTGIAPVEGNPSALEFTYRVFLGEPAGGVSHRTATFHTRADDSGLVMFDYVYEIFHSWYNVHAVLEVFNRTAEKRWTKKLVRFSNLATTGPRTFTGSAKFRVHAGCPFGFAIGGSNFDSNSILEGKLTLTNFRAPIWIPPEEKVLAGPLPSDPQALAWLLVKTLKPGGALRLWQELGTLIKLPPEPENSPKMPSRRKGRS